METMLQLEPPAGSARFDVETRPAIAGVSAKQSRIIQRLLAPALQFWLRSQVEQFENLRVELEGSDRQVLSGYLPQVRLTAEKVVYRGLHLSQVDLVGRNLRLNLGQVLQGKPLKLLEPVPLDLQVCVTATDLNASAQTPMLVEALTDLLLSGPRSGAIAPSEVSSDQPFRLQKPEFHLDENHLTLAAELVSVRGTTLPALIRTGLRLVNPQTLQLVQPQGLPHPSFWQLEPQGFQIDFGPEVALQELSVTAERIFCQGRITVLP